MNFTTGGDQNCFVMILRSRILKVFLVLGLSFMLTAVYVNFFQHPPPDMLLAMNNRASGSNFGPPRSFGPAAQSPSRDAYGGSKHRRPVVDDEEEEDVVGEDVEGVEEEEEEEYQDGAGEDNFMDEFSEKRSVKKSDRREKAGREKKGRRGGSRQERGGRREDKGGRRGGHEERGGRREERKERGGGGGGGSSGVKYEDFWNTFLQRNNFVTIGAIYNSCENWHTQFGTVVMLADKEQGGVKSRTFINLTLDHEIDGGQFNIEVKYNGKDLYDNYWEICELDEELPPQNRTFNCPVAAGHHSKVKDKHIPNYLPKGRYQTKAWATGEDEKVFACGYSDFTI